MGLIENIKRYLDSLDDAKYKNEMKTNPLLASIAKAILYKRGGVKS